MIFPLKHQALTPFHSTMIFLFVSVFRVFFWFSIKAKLCRYFCWYSFYLMDCNCVSFKPLLYLRISNRNSANKVYTFNSVLDISFSLWHCSAMRDEKEMRRAIFVFIFQVLLKASIYNNWTFFNNFTPPQAHSSAIRSKYFFLRCISSYRSFDKFHVCNYARFPCAKTVWQ